MSFFYLAGLNPIDIGVFFGAKMSSAIGMKVGVPENPFNKLAFDLKQKEERLDEREKELNQREKTIREIRDNNSNDLLIIILGIGIGIFIVLIAILSSTIELSEA